MPFWRMHCHLIWSTKDREPAIDATGEAEIRTSIIAVAHKFGGYVHAVGVVENHVHVAVSIPPSRRVSDVVREMKGRSAYHVNLKRGEDQPRFIWQTEYGALSFGDSAMEGIVKYVLNQKEHHRNGTTHRRFEIDSE